MERRTQGETPKAIAGAEATVNVPEAFGRYAVVRPLAQGGMGSVFVARDDRLGREVALKILRPVPAFDKTSRVRFLNEAKAVASLEHPHIVSVHDVGIEGDTPFIVMELVRGRSLAEILAERKTLPPSDVVTLGIQIARALARAHEAGIVHRDVKPANILEAEPGRWKLADFGVARLPDSSLTSTGIFIGTPGYGAPEALTAGEFGTPCDLFSLGAVLYECLTGSWLQKGRDVLQAAVAYEMTELAPPGQLVAGVPPSVDAAVLAAVARDPARRPSATGLADALAGMSSQQQHATSRSPRTSPQVVPPPLAIAPTVDLRSIVPPTATGILAPETVVGRRPHWMGAIERRPWLWLSGAALALVLLGVLIGQLGDDPAAPRTGGVVAATELDEPATPSGPAPAPTTEESGDGPPWPDPADLAATPRFSRGKGKGKGKGKDRGNKTRDRWRHARERFEEGDVGEAAHEVGKILEDNPDDPFALAWMEWATQQEFDVREDDED